jgi:hypothetical protein
MNRQSEARRFRLPGRESSCCVVVGLPRSAAPGGGRTASPASPGLSLRRRACSGRSRTRLLTAAEHENFIKRSFDFQEAERRRPRQASQKPAKGKGGRHTCRNQGAATRLVPTPRQTRHTSPRTELIVPGDVAFIAHALVVPSTEPNDLERIRPTSNRSPWTWYAPSRGDRRQGPLILRPSGRAAGLPDHPGFDVLSVRPGNGGAR